MSKAMESANISALTLSASVSHEVSTDVVLPEYLPPVRRVLNVEVTPLPESRFLSGSAIELGGTAAFTVLYIGEDGTLACAPATAEYTASCGLGDAPVTDAARVGVDTVVESVNCHVGGPRSLTLRSRMRTHLLRITDRPLEERLSDAAGIHPTAADALTIQRKEASIPHVCVHRGDATITVSGTLSVAPGTKILRASGAVRIEDARAEEGAVQLRGEVWMHALGLSPEGTFIRLDGKIPFTESVPVPDAMAGDAARGWGRVASVEIRPLEDGGMELGYEIEADIEAETARAGMSDVSIDAYSTAYRSEAAMEDLESVALLRCGQCALSVSGEGGRQSRARPGEMIIDATAAAMPDHMERRGDTLILHGAAAVSVHLTGEGDAVSEEFTVPFRCEMPLDTDADGEMIWRAAPAVISVAARPDGDKIAVNLEMCISVFAAVRYPFRRVSAITLDTAAPHPARDGEITICYPTPGESLWDIAKRYAVKPDTLEPGDAIVM